MADRPTFELETKAHGHRVTLREWITYQEYREIMAVYLKAMTIKAGTDAAEVSAAAGDTVVEAENRAVKAVVISLDGSTENIVERMQALPMQDAQEIVAAVETVSNPKKK